MANRDRIVERMRKEFAERLANTIYSTNSKAKRALGAERNKRKLTNKEIYNAEFLYFNTYSKDA